MLKLAHNEKVRKNTDQTTDMNLHKIITLKKSKIELDEIVQQSDILKGIQDILQSQSIPGPNRKLVRELFHDNKKPGASPVKGLIDGRNTKLLNSEFKKQYGYKDALRSQNSSKEKLPKIQSKRIPRKRNGNISTQILDSKTMVDDLLLLENSESKGSEKLVVLDQKYQRQPDSNLQVNMSLEKLKFIR